MSHYEDLTIGLEELFPNHFIQYRYIDKKDGWYTVISEDSQGPRARVYIQDKKLLQYDIYLNTVVPYLTWTFEYNERKSVYREFPHLNIPKEWYYDSNVHIKMQDFSGDVQDVCIICFDNYEEQDGITLLCKHSYHTRCIKAWSSKSKMCPICRNDMT